jgi:hypothetical protein
MMGNWNLPYANQDTNVVIESYHANLKAILRAAKVTILWKMGGLVHPLAIGRCFVALLVSEFEKVGGLFRTRSRNDLLLTLFFVQKASQTTV